MARRGQSQVPDSRTNSRSAGFPPPTQAPSPPPAWLARVLCNCKLNIRRKQFCLTQQMHLRGRTGFCIHIYGSRQLSCVVACTHSCVTKLLFGRRSSRGCLRFSTSCVGAAIAADVNHTACGSTAIPRTRAPGTVTPTITGTHTTLSLLLLLLLLLLLDACPVTSESSASTMGTRLSFASRTG